MGDSMLIENIDEKLPLPNIDMDSFINMLWDQDMDMGVDRQFYDPVYRDHEIKKQEAEQQRLQELRKNKAKQEMLYFTIDEETGERIPNPSAGPYQPPSEFTDSDLSKELAELGEIDDLSYLLGEEPKPQARETNTQMYVNTQEPTPQPRTHHDYNVIIAGQPSPDIDLWPTEITMMPGPSEQSSNSQTPMSMAEPEMYLRSDWGNNNRTAGFYETFNDEAVPAYQPQPESSFVNEVAPHNPYLYDITASDSTYTTKNPSTKPFVGGSDGSNCSYSSQSFNEDVKPQFMYNLTPNLSTLNADASTSSAGYSGSDDDLMAGMSKSEREKERRNVCRDELRCKELVIPFTVGIITNCPVEEFNSLLRQHRLTEEQLTLVKDIRRRGKNKVAAQNCRKKKMNELTGLELEIRDLKRKRSDLMRDKDDMKRSKQHLRKQLDQTYAEVFNSVRDHLGRPYDPRYYTLHISDEGDARVIPNKVNTMVLLGYQQNA